MKKNNGFTLVELLAAIVILGVLMTVAAGAFGSIKENNAKKELEQIAGSIKKVGETMYTSSVIKEEILLDGVSKKKVTYNGQQLYDAKLIESATVENPYDKNSTCSIKLTLTKTSVTASTEIKACVTCVYKRKTIEECK